MPISDHRSIEEIYQDESLEDWQKAIEVLSIRVSVNAEMISDIVSWLTDPMLLKKLSKALEEKE